MRKISILALAILAATTLSRVALAGEATRMTDEEMDNVSAAGIGQTISTQAQLGLGGVAMSALAKESAPGQAVSAQAKGGLSVSNRIGNQGLGRGLGRSFAPGLN